MTQTHAADLASIYAVALTLAGADYMWTHPDAPKTLNSAHRRGLTALLRAAQGDVCAACGDSMTGERVELCHVVASRRSGYGLMAGNAYVGHVGCNSDDDKVFGGGAVPLATLLRADLIALTWPTRAQCLATDAGETTRRARRRDARLAALPA